MEAIWPGEMAGAREGRPGLRGLWEGGCMGFDMWDWATEMVKGNFRFLTWESKYKRRTGLLSFLISPFPSTVSFDHTWLQCGSRKSQHKGALLSVFICSVPTPNPVWMVRLHSWCYVPPPLHSVSTLSPLAAHSFLSGASFSDGLWNPQALCLCLKGWSWVLLAGVELEEKAAGGPHWWVLRGGGLWISCLLYTLHFSPTGKGPPSLSWQFLSLAYLSCCMSRLQLGIYGCPDLHVRGFLLFSVASTLYLGFTGHSEIFSLQKNRIRDCPFDCWVL